MAKKQTDHLDELRAALDQAKAKVDKAQVDLDELLVELAGLPAVKDRAIAAGDSAAFLMAQGRAGQLEAAVYFARSAVLRAEKGANEAESALLEAELPPLLEEHRLRTEAERAAATARITVGNEIEPRRSRLRLLNDGRRRIDEKLFGLQSEFEKSTRLDAAPVVRALNAMPRPY